MTDAIATESEPKVLDVSKPQKVSYCIPMWLRDEQIRVNMATVPLRFSPSEVLRDEPIAVVCYGPSLNDTWEQVKGFQYIISCSGAHKFLIERGIVPTWHVDVDPRKHKIPLIGEPHKDVEYLIAATCHPDYFTMLKDGGFTVKLWHIFDPSDASLRELPAGEWAVTGGCSVGLRALTMARLLGFRNQHIFGMDGNQGKSGKHAAAHPNQATSKAYVDHGGRRFETTPAFLEAARGTFHELDQLKDVVPTFYGDGLVQSMAKDWTRATNRPEPEFPAFIKPELISEEYRTLNARLHRDNLAYGVGGGNYADTVQKLVEKTKSASVLDYGCGKGYLAKQLPFPIWEYDPAVPGKDATPRPADLVICTDVLEHIEPEKLLLVLDDLRRCVKQIGYFVIHTGAAAKTLADGRNAHLIQQPKAWWDAQLANFFTVAKINEKGQLLHVVVAPSEKTAVKKQGPKLSFDRLRFRRDPYAIGVASQVLDPSIYQALCGKFPAVELCKAFGNGIDNRKWSLSEVNNPENYHAFIAASPLWTAFHAYIKSPAFIEQMRVVLLSHGLDPIPKGPAYRSRFEYSLLPADGGALRPHTDIPSKLVTLVVSMLPEAKDWDPAWGGGTDVLKPKAGRQIVLQDYKAGFDEFDVVETFPYVSNQCVVFVKTDDSWHSVGPLTGTGSDALRRTLTINIERPA